MNIKEVFEKCNNGEYVIDNYKRRWKVDNGELTVSCLWPTLYNLYSLKLHHHLPIIRIQSPHRKDFLLKGN